MPFLLDYSPSNIEISDAVNYLLGNLNPGTIVDQKTGEITTNNTVIGYLYQYVSIKYAQSYDGTVGFSNVPTNALYFGVRNTNSTVESTDPADYVWRQATGGFGTTKFLWYVCIGGRQIKFYVGAIPPSADWLQDSGSAIDLDIVFSSLVASLIRPIDVVPANSSGVVATLPSSNYIKLYMGNTQVTNGVTYSGTATKNGLTLTVNSSTGEITFSQTSWTTIQETFVITATVVGVNFTVGYSITKAVAGPTGADGNKSITICCFKWSNSGASVPSQSFTYTWATGNISAYPSGWTSAATTSPGTGYTLYQLNLIIVDTVGAATTNANWNSATLNSIGYREDGSIGLQGDGARIAYCKSTIASPSGTTTSTGSSSLPATGSFGLTGSVFYTSPPSLVTGEYLYQTDGIYVVSTNTITWSTPYLSNLKVGSLSAISANLGVVEISTDGNLHSGKTSFADTTAGFFLGNDSGTPRLSIGNSSKSLSWDGSSLTLNGDLIATGNINNHAVTNTVMTFSSFTPTVNGNDYGTPFVNFTAITITTIAGSSVRIDAPVYCYLDLTNTAIETLEFNVALYKGSTVLTSVMRCARSCYNVFEARSYFDSMNLSYIDTPSSGSNTYQIQAWVVFRDSTGAAVTSGLGGSSTNVYYYFELPFIVQEIKR